MASAGRILIMPKGNYDSSATYEMLDMVHYNGTSWLAKKTATGVEPSAANSEHWHNMFDIEIANNLTTTDEGKALDARQGKILNDKKQERIMESVNLARQSSYTITLFKESCLLCAYLVDPVYYSGIFACCGINEYSYSIQTLNESIYDDNFSAEIGNADGSELNKITFYNRTDNDVTLVLVKLPI